MTAKFITSIFCILFLLSTGLFAQDTIVVQTFTLDTDDRVGVFDFPDDPTENYEKILMLYQMRCHDNQVGNGNVGCREWDYSCNTFITDSTRVDSNKATHPTHIISNFSEEVFEYTTQPTYTYYQYEQIEVNYLETNSETIASVGDGIVDVELAGNSARSKMQLLYTASELTASGLSAGAITGMQLDVADIGDELSFLRIRLKPTAKTALVDSDPDLDGFTEVYFLNTQFSNTGNHSFNFYNNFDWDGSSNVIVELSYTNTSPTTASTIKGHDSGFDATISSKTDYSLSFYGAGAIPIDGAALSGISDQITVSLWANGAADVLPTNTTIFEGIDDDNLRQANVHLPWSNGQVYWDCGNDGGGYDRINLTADPSAWEGQWNHWAFTKNATSGEMKIFLNGELFHSGTGKTKLIDITALNFASSSVLTNNYYGMIDELQIWNVELEQATIQNWMRKSIDNSHPNYANLLSYLPLNEGTGNNLTDASGNMSNTTASGAPNWSSLRGKDLYKDFETSTLRPNIDFVQGDYLAEALIFIVQDSVLNNQQQIVEYGVNGTDLVELQTSYVYQATPANVYDENGTILSSIDVTAENAIEIGSLTYYDKFPSKYEILSLVTPYGNGLSLGADGKTFTFDVTDYGPILKGSKRMSIEMGGENQEELDIKFLFIKGTPTRPVLDVQNIWAFRRGWFDAIQSDGVFEPRSLSLDANADHYEIRASITGHGQNGEFVQRSHYVNLNGGANEFEFPVWKECGDIPIYPQGGTWLFDRAGWCPGDPTQVHRLDITPHVTLGGTVEIDYGVLGGPMSEANYLVSQQLVTYGAPNFATDAAIVDVIRPSNKVEHQRFNPACNTPRIMIQNNGTTPLTSLDITYSVLGGSPLTHNWSGSLEFLESVEVELPVEDITFWGTLDEPGVFEVSIANPNGSTDGYLPNNTMRSNFEEFKIFEGTIFLRYKTNNRPQENHMYITDAAGDVVLERTNMAINTIYEDDIDLPSGCYTLHFDDTGDDGLYYWYYAATNQNVGTGYLKIRRFINENLDIPAQDFEPEFGSFVHFDFYLPEPVSTEEKIEDATLISLYPNPSDGLVNLDLLGFENKDIRINVVDAAGKNVKTIEIANNTNPTFKQQIDLSEYPNGIYMISIFDGEKYSYKKWIKSTE